MDNFKVIGNVVGVPNPKTDSYSKKEIDDMFNTNMGDVETALDNIIAIQNTLIGGDSV